MQFTEPVIIAYTKGKVMCKEVDFALNTSLLFSCWAVYVVDSDCDSVQLTIINDVLIIYHIL